VKRSTKRAAKRVEKAQGKEARAAKARTPKGVAKEQRKDARRAAKARARRRVRRQWGADRRTRALRPIPKPAARRAVSGARFAIFVTTTAWVAYLVTTLSKAFFGDGFSLRYAFDAAVYIVVVTLLVGSALAYLLARVGFLYRTRNHHRIARAVIDDFFAESLPTLTVIVPSFREDARVIRQTLLSAALQEYPYLRVVLLIDDPPNPTEPEHMAMLEAARALPLEIEDTLRRPREHFEAALEQFESEATSAPPPVSAMYDLADEYTDAATWLTDAMSDDDVEDHADEFLRRDVLLRLADDFHTVADALRAAADDGVTLGVPRMLQLYRRLAWTFRADVSKFERKAYISCSHEPNKAMNLNSYLALMGGCYAEHESRGGRVLTPVVGPCDLEVPETDYVLTLDADSVLLPEYCLRLVYFMEQPENDRVAVAQTPYSAYPGAPTRIERLAGATTDIQHIVHQGLTYYGATFWVGANAVLRKHALDDICAIEREGAFTVKRYIQDRTVIEDTESSVDLGIKGWYLYNYPERLSYSATPPDFGSLCVQRQRWANGGLLVIEKLRRYMKARRARSEHGRALAEIFLRTNYLASITWASIGLILLLVYPFNAALLSPLALLTAGPYFLAMANDLKRCGYKRTDVFRIYGLNLLLLPVNVSGVVKSLGQAIGGQKIAFARTPKVRNRTTAPISFVGIPYLIVGFSVFTVWRDLEEGHYPHAAFAAANALLCMYAIVAFVGLRHSLVDISLNVYSRLFRTKDDTGTQADDDIDWVTVLYHGAGEDHAHSAVARPSAALALAGEHTISLEDDAAPEIAVERRATAVLTDDAGDPFDTFAALLGDHLKQMRTDGRLVLRLDGRALEVSLEPSEPGDA
jgi:cellulose synthase/poly-beta-1,6-N-acetylglucosamine synthase-like glycosyltransferase